MDKMDELINKLSEKIKLVTDSYHAIGNPIIVEGHTIIPITSVSIGLAGGGGNANAKGKGGENNRSEASIDTAGGGGGLRLKPLGFLVVSKEKVQLLPLPVAPFRLPEFGVGNLLHGIAEIIEKIKTPSEVKEEVKEEIKKES